MKREKKEQEVIKKENMSEMFQELLSVEGGEEDDTDEGHPTAKPGSQSPFHTNKCTVCEMMRGST